MHYIMFDMAETTIAPCGDAPCTTLYCVIHWRMQIDALCFAVALSAKGFNVKVSYYRVQAGMNVQNYIAAAESRHFVATGQSCKQTPLSVASCIKYIANAANAASTYELLEGRRSMRVLTFELFECR